MPIYTKSSAAQLRKRLSEVKSALKSQSPDLFAEMELLERLVEASQKGTQPLFAKVRNVIGAIELCFDLTGDWMTKQQLVDMILEGGYPLQPKTARGLINDALNYHTERNRIARTGDTFGRPTWVARNIAK